MALTVFLVVLAVVSRSISWQGSKDLHTLMEVMATLLALFVVAISSTSQESPHSALK